MKKSDERNPNQYELFKERITLENASQKELIDILINLPKVYQEDPYKGLISFTAGGIITPGSTDSHSKIIEFLEKNQKLGTIPFARPFRYDSKIGQLVPSSENIPIYLGSGLESRILYREAHRLAKLGGRDCQVNYFFPTKAARSGIDGDFQRFIEQCFDDPYGYQISNINIECKHEKNHLGYKSERKGKTRETEAHLLFDNSDGNLNLIIDPSMRCEKMFAISKMVSSVKAKRDVISIQTSQASTLSV